MVRRVAKYDWSNLEKEYILSDYKSVSAFLKNKGIPNNGSTKKSTKGWKEKKVQKEYQKSTKTIEKVIEKEAERDSEQIVNTKDTAKQLLIKINESIEELNKYIVKSKVKTKAVKYDYKVGKAKEEIVTEKEELNELSSIIDKAGLKSLASALKDIDDILEEKNPDPNQDKMQKVNELLSALEGEANDT